MKRYAMVLSLVTSIWTAKAQLPDFARYPIYTGNDLGAAYTPAKTTFKIWSPKAQKVVIDIQGANDTATQTHNLLKGKDGTWAISLPRDQKGKQYTFRVMHDDKWSNAVPDPYAKAVTINGKEGMVIDLKETNPAGWAQDKSPVFKNPTDAIIYELHVRDASIAASSGIEKKGKFLGLTELQTKNKAGLSTGLSHIKELGVTHVHLLPFYDYNSVDEKNPDSKYNWGYDPLNYNVPEGSYSTNAADGVTRIREFKQLVKTFHENGLRVVMDVVYNHTALTETSNFNQLVPGYYYRQTKEGKFSDATACGNETASERPMYRKFMLESMKYWVQEYHVDGFRMDLMGVHDISTINLISRELHKIKPDILIYGEGWTAGASPLPDSLRAIKANAYKLDRVAVFSDDLRDGIKGSVFDHNDKGFASGKPGMEESIKFGIVASCKHPDIDYTKVNYSKAPYAAQPWNTISYCECHDNHVLWDKLAISAKDATEEERIAMHKLALSIVLTSQGISFLHAGTEFLRSKKGVENSYNSSDSINAIDWNLKTRHEDVFNYVKGLIKLRKEHPAFRMKTAKDIAANLHFIAGLPSNVIGYTIDGAAAGDSWGKIMVFFNGNPTPQRVSWTKGQWNFADPANPGNQLSLPATSGTSLEPYSCIIAYL